MVARRERIESCRTCTFFGQLADYVSMASLPMKGTMGSCMRFPPIVVHDDCLNGEFPAVHSSMWCGEYKDDANPDLSECESL